MNATGRASRPSKRRKPPKVSIIPPAKNNGGRCAGMGNFACGKPNSFCVPCSTNTKHATIRNTLSTRGPHTSSLFHIRLWATAVVDMLMIQLITRSLQLSCVCCCAREVLHALIRTLWPGYELIERDSRWCPAVWFKSNIPRALDSCEGLLNSAWNGPRRRFRGMPENDEY